MRLELDENLPGEQVLADPCKWMDAKSSLATLRHGFKCYGRTLRAVCFKATHGLNPDLEAFEKNAMPPACPQCGAPVRTATISFGQAMPEAEMKRAGRRT